MTIAPPGLATAKAAAHLRTLANPQRLLAVLCLARGECTVSRLLECTQANPSVLSQQLRMLLDRGVVSRMRRGRGWFTDSKTPPPPISPGSRAGAQLRTPYRTAPQIARGAHGIRVPGQGFGHGR